jgi:2-polyprenyl-3-methyl-5-hydroxy-6-metoxy-1,4-benzoquinol methylase
MYNKEEQLTAHLYGRLYDNFGQSYKTLNWGNPQTQHLRFRILTEIGNLEGKSILDVGCGLGDFAEWLGQNNMRVDYTGLDLTPELVNQARKNHPELTFLQGSILEESLLAGQTFDFVFASGIFYTYKMGGNVWLQKAVARMWTLCKEGLAFNSLSAWAESHDADEFYADPPLTLEYCKRLTPWVAFRHDYHPRDFTVYLSRMARE